MVSSLWGFTNDHLRTSEMAELVKVLAIAKDDLSSSSSSHMVEGKNQLLRVVP